MMIKKALVAAALVFASTQAFAGPTCATATPLLAPGGPYAGDTSGAGGGHDIDAIGPLPLAGAPSSIYKFTLAPGGTVSGTIQLTASFPAGIFVTANCQATTSAPLDGTTDGSTVTLTPSNYTAGNTYYVIVSTDPSQASSSNAGPFSIAVTPTLPVSLQNFSVE